MSDFILLHGGGMGGWTWRYVRELLEARGHRVLTPTFTGFGERHHLITRDITHDVHVADIVNVLQFEGVRDAVIVAHSYAGTVVPGVVAAVAPGTIARVVYLDAIVPQAGEPVVVAMGAMPAEQAQGLDAMMAAGDGPIGSGVDEQQRAMAKDHPHAMSAERQDWLLANLTDMPLRGVVSPVATGADTLTLPVDYIAATDTIMGPMRTRAETLGWPIHVHPGDHALLVGDPEGTVALIEAIVAPA